MKVITSSHEQIPNNSTLTVEVKGESTGRFSVAGIFDSPPLNSPDGEVVGEGSFGPFTLKKTNDTDLNILRLLTTIWDQASVNIVYSVNTPDGRSFSRNISASVNQLNRIFFYVVE